jgi:pimeloyl-ACP methyl ester carboxylesterase
MLLLSGCALALVTSPPRPPVVIVPGFGNDQIDYMTPLGQPANLGLVSVLKKRGFTDVEVVPVQRWEWARVAAGLLQPMAWARAEQRPTGYAYGWFVKRIRDTIDTSRARSGRRVLIISHSAGGWLARAAIGGVPGDGAWARMDERVGAFVSLGSPHSPPPELSTCATRGALAFVNENYPGAFVKGISYTTVAGAAVIGSESGSPQITAPQSASVDAANALYAQRGEGSYAGVAFTNYKMLSGAGEGVAGDGIIPVRCAHLEGAEQITLEGVTHSINEPGTTLPTDRWYGSEDVVDRWLERAMAGAGL